MQNSFKVIILKSGYKLYQRNFLNLTTMATPTEKIIKESINGVLFVL